MTIPIEEITQDRLAALAPLMDDELRERLAAEMRDCEPGELLAAWALVVGPEQAGIIILGS